MEEKIEEVKIPVVVGEIFELLEEKRVKCVKNIEKRFEEYYKYNRLIYHKFRSNLVKITYPTNPSIIYSFKTKENMRNFFNYWLFYDYSNPNWETEGVNILNVLVNLENAYLYKNEWKDFNYWWKQKVIEQNLAYRYKNDHLYLWDIEYQSNTLFQILKGMNFNDYKSLIGKLSEIKNLWETEATKQRKQKIEVYNKALSKKTKQKKWSKYVKRWIELKDSTDTIYEAFNKLIRENPNDKQLEDLKPESFNRNMNNYIKKQPFD